MVICRNFVQPRVIRQNVVQTKDVVTDHRTVGVRERITECRASR
jgi:hypothetical protein